MIKSFNDGRTQGIWERKRMKGFPSDLYKSARRKLGFLEDAVMLDDLRVPPGNNLEALQGERKGQYSIRINDQWRVCFNWKDGQAYEVEITDYH
jgi:proteic killer suppression protein